MKIPGILYLVVGILVTIVSSILEGFYFFIFIGVVFIIVGIIKLITSMNTKKEPESKLDSEIKREEDFIKRTGPDPKNFVKCKYCKAYNYPNAKFCHFCGRRMK